MNRLTAAGIVVKSAANDGRRGRSPIFYKRDGGCVGLKGDTIEMGLFSTYFKDEAPEHKREN